ncbi:hypothetical protein H1C71_039020, partial [Ictidomys tridecemlineatus]
HSSGDTGVMEVALVSAFIRLRDVSPPGGSPRWHRQSEWSGHQPSCSWKVRRGSDRNENGNVRNGQRKKVSLIHVPRYLQGPEPAWPSCGRRVAGPPSASQPRSPFTELLGSL